MRYIYCKQLERRIIIEKDAIENPKWGWICDCGKWTKETPGCHDVIDTEHKKMFGKDNLDYLIMDGEI